MRTIHRSNTPPTLPERRRGAVAPFAALMLVVVVGMVAFSVDVGYITHADTELQRTADACALAAVAELPEQNQAVTAAQSVAEANYASVGPPLNAEDVIFGKWDRDEASFTPTTDEPNAVKIILRRSESNGNPLELFFAPLLGNSEASVTASAIAMYDNKLCGPLVGIDWVSIPGSPTTDSYKSSDGSYESQTPRKNGSVCSDGPIGLEGQAVVNGDANGGKGYGTTTEGSSTVTGSTSPRLRPLNLPGVDPTYTANNNDNEDMPTIQKGNSQVEPLDENRNFLLDGGKTYDLPPGRYYWNDFTLTGQSTLNITGPTTIYLTGNMDTSGGYLANNTQVPNNLQFFMTGGTADITAGIDQFATVYAPNTDVVVDGSAQFYGSVVGGTLEATGTGDIHYDENLDINSEVELPPRIAIVR